MAKGKQTIIMVGPELDGQGGVSRVARTWKECGIFKRHNVLYVGTYSGRNILKLLSMTKPMISFIGRLIKANRIAYVHTSADNSFYRKSMFLFAAWATKKPMILHIHPSSFYDFVVNSNGFRRKLIFFLLQRTVCLVVLSSDMQTRFSALFPGKPVFVLPNTVDIRTANRLPAGARTHRTILYLGWYVREKGVYDLVDAIKILADGDFDVKLEFFGTKESEKLRSYVRNAGLSQRISVNDWINDSDKFKKLATCTALALPSYSEGLPNVILEAMATKTPIIATSVGGLKEILRDGENAFLVRVGDSQDLSDKIKLCILNKNLRERLAETAYQEAVTMYDVNIVCGMLSKILETANPDSKRMGGVSCAE